MRTITTQFDPAVLPDWARRSKAVVDLCARDLAFRCDVFSVTAGPGAKQYSRFLVREAERRISAERRVRRPTNFSGNQAQENER